MDQPIDDTLCVEEYIVEEIRRRRKHGLQKYGQSVDDNKLTLIQWLQHAKEECLDQAIYLERAIREQRKLDMYNMASFDPAYGKDKSVESLHHPDGTVPMNKCSDA